jgi:hypothetical protein
MSLHASIVAFLPEKQFNRLMGLLIALLLALACVEN